MSATIRYSAYVMELRFQGSASKAAFDHLTAAVDRRRELGQKLREIRRAGGPLPLHDEQEAYRQMAMEMANLVPRILEALQSFLVASGIISMLLWPPHGRRDTPPEVLAGRETRGSYLRELLKVDDTSPLKRLRSKTTDARGGLVHYDEMIEEFVGLDPDGDLVTFQIGPLSKMQAVWEPGQTIRWFDDESYLLNVNGRETPLRELLDEIRRVAGQIQVNAKEGLVEGASPDDVKSIAMGIRVDRS